MQTSYFSIMTEFSYFRDDDLDDTVVIDKINIFRADRVFKVFCLSHGCLIYEFKICKR